jgi:hypothetical protein
MSIYGYARVSTFDQDFSIQHAALKMALRGDPRRDSERHGWRRPHQTPGVARLPARRIGSDMERLDIGELAAIGAVAVSAGPRSSVGRAMRRSGRCGDGLLRRTIEIEAGIEAEGRAAVEKATRPLRLGQNGIGLREREIRERRGQ